MYLLDTNVVSELRKSPAARTAARVDRHVMAWTKSVPAASLFLSVISILELELGILLMERRDPRQGAILRAWMEHHVLPAFDGRILPVDTPVAQRCAALHVPDPRSYRDSLIAATALVHGMTVVTQNVRDFQPTGVAILNPWKK
ncbi:MAG: type II toxin-antitoxin system VapC family toxin [Terracidiphilus sp.]